MKNNCNLHYTLCLSLTMFISTFAIAQNVPQGVSIANDQVPPSKNAMLDVVSDSKGILIPRVSYITLSTTLEPQNLVGTEDGLMVYVTDAGSNHGFWYFDSTIGTEGEWVQLLNVNTASASSVWTENGDYPGNIYYQYGTVMINGDADPSDPNAQANLGVFPLQVFTDGNTTTSVKIGGGGTTITNPSNGQPVSSAHLNEINCDETSLDLQFWNGNTVNVGSGVVAADLNVTGITYSAGWWTTSDSTLKTNISELSNSYNPTDVRSKLKNIDLYSYEMKSRPGVKQYGVMAQELELIFPDLVKPYSQVTTKGMDGLTKSEMNIKVVDYRSLSVFALSALKDVLIESESQRTEINTLKDQIDDLTSRIEALER